LSEARQRQRPSLRRSLLDPIVVAAILGSVAGTITTLAGTGRDHDFEREQKRCERAFAFLQDEAVNPRLSVDDEFYQSQRVIADRCSTRKD
jgi:hypothetical protein